MKNFRRKIIALILFGLLFGLNQTLHATSVVRQEKKEVTARHLIICVDGVGFSMIERMRREGRFSRFQNPSHMIAPFPTLTNVSMSEILGDAGAGEAAGYEDSFFDIESNRMRGGLLDRFNEGHFIKGTFRELFDYHPSALKSGLGYAAPPLSTYLEALSDLVRLRQKFRASHEPVFFAYTGATDSLAHLGGQRMVRSFLSKLDETVTSIVRESKEPVEVTIFSDHGNHYVHYQRVPLKEALRRAGMRLESSVRDERSVVLPQLGLVGSAVLFTGEGNEGRVAEAVAPVRGVDFAAYASGKIVTLISRTGEATIERRDERFRYQTLRGDPLGLQGVIAELSAQGRVDADGFVADADWFKATNDGARPDAVRRVYEGLTQHVRNRANVIINFDDGFYAGSYLLDIFASLHATHGNLGREQSYGFVMDTRSDLPTYLRAEDVWHALGSPRLKEN